jgi:hypothetical protein
MNDIRHQYNVDKINECILCRVTKHHSILYVKHTMIDNNAIIYLSPGKAKDTTTFFVCQHFILEIDKCLRENQRFSIVFDFDEYSISKMLENTEIAHSLSTILQNLYNETLDTIYLVDSPFYITPLLSMVQTFFKNSVYEKIKMITKEQYNRMANGYSFRPSPDYNPVCD